MDTNGLTPMEYGMAFQMMDIIGTVSGDALELLSFVLNLLWVQAKL